MITFAVLNLSLYFILFCDSYKDFVASKVEMSLNIEASFAKSLDTSVINRPSVDFNSISIRTRFDVMFGPSYDGIVVHTFKNKVGEYLERMAR